MTIVQKFTISISIFYYLSFRILDYPWTLKPKTIQALSSKSLVWNSFYFPWRKVSDLEIDDKISKSKDIIWWRIHF